MTGPWIPYIQGRFVPNKIEIGPVVLDKKILKKIVHVFHYFVIISPEKGQCIPFDQTWIPISQE